MNVERPLPLEERFLISEVSRDALESGATLTYLAPKNHDVRVRYYDESTGGTVRRQTRFFLEHLAPDEYDAVYRRMVELNAVDEAQGAPAPPLNERAHLSVLILDLDDGNHKLHEVALLGRLVQFAFALHFSVRTPFLVSQRYYEQKARYHLHFPGVLMVDTRLWSAVQSIVYNTARHFHIDTGPLKNRCIRVHGTNRDEGRSEGTGVYRFVLGYHDDFTRMREPPCGNAFSVRPSSAVLAEWMRSRDPRMHFEARTVTAATAYRPSEQGARIPRSLFDAATADTRSAQLCVSDRSGRWFLFECRMVCNIHRDTCQRRILCRVSDVGVNRWSLCVEGGMFVVLPPVQGEPAIENGVAAWPLLGGRGGLSVNRIDSIMTLPLESFYEIGINGRVRLSRFTVIQFAELWRAHAEYALYQVAYTETVQRLTAEQCVVRDVLHGVNHVRVAAGIQVPEIADGTHLVLTLASPCGSGKTFFVFSQIATARKTLVIAPLKALTRELATRIRANVPGKVVVHYKDARGDDLGDIFIVTPESLARFSNHFDADLLVIDEFCTVTKTVYTSSTTEKIRRETERALMSVIAKTPRCIVMDRDIGPIERMVLGSVLAYAPTVFWPPERNNGAAPNYHVHAVTLADWVNISIVYHDTYAVTLCAVRECLEAGQRVALFSASASFAFAVGEMFSDEFRVKVVAGAVDEATKADFATQPDTVLARDDTQLLVYTTTANVGISIERHPFEHVFVVLGRHLTLRDAIQAERRVRHLVGQDANERVFHLCPGDVRPADYVLKTMPTVGDAVAIEQARCASGVSVRANVHAFDIDGAPQMRETMPEIVQIAVNAVLEHERALQGTVVDQWLSDIGAEIEHVLEEDYDEDAVKEMRDALRQCKRDAKTTRNSLEVLGERDDAETVRVKRSRMTSIVPDGLDAIAARNIDLVRWSSQFGARACRVWAALLLPAAAVVELDLHKSVADSVQIGLPGTGMAPMALFALACLRLVRADNILSGVACTPLRHDRSATVLSPFDGTSAMTADEFFTALTELGRPSKSAHAAFHGDRTKSLVRFIAAYDESGLNHAKVSKHRLQYCKSTAQKLLGGKMIWDEPQRMLWCTAHYLTNEGIAHNIDGAGDPWGIMN